LIDWLIDYLPDIPGLAPSCWDAGYQAPFFSPSEYGGWCRRLISIVALAYNVFYTSFLGSHWRHPKEQVHQL
jgi:hypothetical protein